MKTLRIELTVADAKVQYNGMTELEIIGRTEADVSHRIRIMLAPSAIGYLAGYLHKAVKQHERNVVAMKDALRGSDG